MLIKIIFEDKYFLVVKKPKGLIVHKNSNFDNNLIDILSKNFNTNCKLVHRLDKDASGLILISKLEKFNIKKLFIKKTYSVLVYGKWPFNIKKINIPLSKKYFYKKKIFIKADIGGKISITKIKNVKYFNNLTFLNLKTFSGRTHQIRYHLSFFGYPIVGDRIYGVFSKNDKKINMQLHCVRLSFFHPLIYKKIKVYSKYGCS